MARVYAARFSGVVVDPDELTMSAERAMSDAPAIGGSGGRESRS